jgi:hypothetical protein
MPQSLLCFGQVMIVYEIDQTLAGLGHESAGVERRKDLISEWRYGSFVWIIFRNRRKNTKRLLSDEMPISEDILIESKAPLVALLNNCPALQAADCTTRAVEASAADPQQFGRRKRTDTRQRASVLARCCLYGQSIPEVVPSRYHGIAALLVKF